MKNFRLDLFPIERAWLLITKFIKNDNDKMIRIIENKMIRLLNVYICVFACLCSYIRTLNCNDVIYF